MAQPLLLGQLVEMGLEKDELNVPSTSPATTEMNLRCDSLGWKFQLRKDRGIEVSDLLEFIHNELKEPVREREVDQGQLQAAYEERARRHRRQGIKDQSVGFVQRLDFLRGQTIFSGLYPLLEEGTAEWLMIFDFP